MSRNVLRSMLAPGKATTSLLQQLLASTAQVAWVEDPDGELLFGKPEDIPTTRQEINGHEKVLGYVVGAGKAQMIANWLSQWALQEESRKKMGAEVLHLYREINLIFNFSERLATTVGVGAIAHLALEEASRLIRFQYGAVLFQSNPDLEPEILAERGEKPLNASKLHLNAGAPSDIVKLPPGTGAQWMMRAPLKIKNHTLGAILLLRNDAEEFRAADLKLLTTLALQSAAAMESSLMYEKERTRALEQQREKLTIDLALRNPFFRKVAATIERHIADPDFNVDKLSAAMNLSPSQLQRKVLTLTDKTPLQVIRSMRLDQARELLSETDLTVAEIAWKCGFSDPSYFSRIFKSEEGSTPTQWRETV